MGRKPAEPANEFSVKVLQQIELLRTQMGVQQREMIDAAGLSPNYFYKRLRGELPLTTNDVHLLARALGHDALLILERAARPVTAVDVVGPPENVDLHEIDLSQGDVDLAATHDQSTVVIDRTPDYENESQDTEENQ